MMDLMASLGQPVILVSRHYLGSINHTLLSIAALRAAKIDIAGLIYSGDAKPTTEGIIEEMTGISPLFRIPEWPDISSERINDFAQKLDLSSLN